MSIEPGDENIKTLYKYRILKSESESESDSEIDDYTFKMLKEGQIYFAKPRSFNDPFDMKIDYDTEATDSDKMNYYVKLGFTKINIEKLMMQKELAKSIMDNYIDENRDGAEDLMNVFCLSKNSNNILMWSHYAANHTGICIGFKTYRFKNNLNMKVKPKCIQNKLPFNLMPISDVIYSNDMPPPVNIYKYEDKDFRPFIITKSAPWEYEDEARVVLTNDELLKNPVCVSHEEISEIIFGLNTPKDLEKKVINIVNNYPDGGSNVKIYKSVMVTGKYELRKELY